MDRRVIFCVLAACIAAVQAAPSGQQRVYEQHSSPQLNPQLNYYIENQDSYYNPSEQRQRETNDQGSPARLETLEPDSEVELVPGVAPPQQPPQQNPVAPNIPGLLPGQRVFIVHMPIPGYRPGTIGGYQPVYIVAAGAQPNPGYLNNGFQNAIIVDPSGQPVSPYLGYHKAVIAPQQHPNILLGGSLAYSRPVDLIYQDVANPAGQVLQGGAIHLGQQVGLQGPIQGHAAPIFHGQAAPTKQGQSEPLVNKEVQNDAKDGVDAPKAKLRSGANTRKL